jgi:hypothetical protein
MLDFLKKLTCKLTLRQVFICLCPLGWSTNFEGSESDQIQCIIGTPTKRQVSKRPVSKRLKRQVCKTLGLQNVRSSKRPVAKNIHIYSVLVVGGNPKVLLQPCLQAK